MVAATKEQPLALPLNELVRIMGIVASKSRHFDPAITRDDLAQQAAVAVLRNKLLHEINDPRVRYLWAKRVAFYKVARYVDANGSKVRARRGWPLTATAIRALRGRDEARADDIHDVALMLERSGLTEGERAMLHAYIVEGLTKNEIIVVHHVDKKTIYRRLDKAIAKVRDRFPEFIEPEDKERVRRFRQKRRSCTAN